MNKRRITTQREHQSIAVEQLRAGDLVDLGSEDALVILVEKADQKCILVAFEGLEPVEYLAGAKVRIQARTEVGAGHTLVS